MADLGGVFRVEDVEPDEYSVIPAGQYQAVAIDSQWKLTRNRDGKYLEFKFQIVDQHQNGRFIWYRLNLQNSSDDAVRIARQQLAKFAQAAGIEQAADSAELHNRPVMLSIVVKEYNGGHSNEIKSISPVGSTAKPATANPAPVQYQASTPASKPNWL